MKQSSLWWVILLSSCLNLAAGAGIYFGNRAGILVLVFCLSFGFFASCLWNLFREKP